jgi:hypothetical protein
VLDLIAQPLTSVAHAYHHCPCSSTRATAVDIRRRRALHDGHIGNRPMRGLSAPGSQVPAPWPLITYPREKNRCLGTIGPSRAPLPTEDVVQTWKKHPHKRGEAAMAEGIRESWASRLPRSPARGSWPVMAGLDADRRHCVDPSEMRVSRWVVA